MRFSGTSRVASNAVRWLLPCCWVAAAHAGCTPRDDEPRLVEAAGVQTAVPGSTGPAAVTAHEVQAVQVARAEAWDRYAAALPEGYLLSIELLHPGLDQAFAVVTAVKDHRAVQSVVGNAPSLDDVAAGDPASPMAVAIGEPPPKQPTEPGIAALGTSLLADAFGAGAGARAAPVRRGVTERAAPHRGAAAVTRSSVSAEDVARFKAAWWRAMAGLAGHVPDGHVLSVELLRSRPDQAFAVFTAVKAGQPVQYVVGTAPSPVALAAADDPASPSAIALGEPPPKDPPPPGIVAEGTSLLNAAFRAQAAK